MRQHQKTISLILFLFIISFNTQASEDIINVRITKPTASKSADLITQLTKEWLKKLGLPPLESPQYPEGTQKAALSKKCQPFIFEKALASSSSPKIFSEKVNALFAECEESWRNLNTPGLLGLLEFTAVEYNFSKNEQIRSIDFEFKNGFHLKGFIAVKDLQNKRPWVLIKCGVFCAAEESSSMRNFVMNLFDESPFNILILGNRTGEDFIKDNKTVSVGGLYESADFFAVANWIHKHELYGKTVSSFHALGISLGGSASVMAEHYHPAYEINDNARIASFTAICPVVDLQPTIHDMFAPGIKGELFSRLTWSQLMTTKHRLSEDQDLLKSSRRPSGEEFIDLFAQFGLRSGQRMQAHPSYFGKHPLVHSINDYWSLSNFTEQERKIEKPLFVWASKDDMIVSNRINTAHLEQSALAQDNNLALVNVNYGNHCGFTTAYGHAVTSAILRSFILSQSPEYDYQRTYHEKEFHLNKNILSYGETHLRQIWFTKENSEWVTLRFETFSSYGEACYFNTPDDKFSECKKTKNIKMSLKSLPVKVDIPRNKEEAAILNRYLNTHLKLYNNAMPIEMSELEANRIQWRE